MIGLGCCVVAGQTVLLLAAALPLTSAKGAATVAAEATSPTVQIVTFSGHPSLLEAPNPPLFGEPQPVCATFRVSALTSVASLDLYVGGLGQATLAEVPAEHSEGCPVPTALRDRLTLSKTATAIDHLVAIKIPVEALSGPGSTMQGNVVALADGKKAGEFSVRVKRPPRAEVWTAITWVATILVPAAVTFLIGQVGAWLIARQKEEDDFLDYRRTSTVQIQNFLGRVHALIRTHKEAAQDHPGWTVSGLIADFQIFARMPRRHIRKLSAACAKDELINVVSLLKDLYPEFPHEINLLEQELNN